MKAEQVTAKPKRQAKTHPEYWSVNFDLRDFRAKHPSISRGEISKKLGISEVSLDNYRARGLTPLPVYKAIVEAFAPTDAHPYQLKLLVSRTQHPFRVTDATLRLAAAYDKRNAGTTITLADGKGFYKIAEEQANGEPPTFHDREVPLDEEAIAGSITPEKAAPSLMEETVILLQQQEALIAVLARVTQHRDELAIENSHLKQLVSDRDITISTQAATVKNLTQQVREWEELSRAETLKGTHTQDAILIADTVVERLRGQLKASGHGNLVQELERISPKTVGHHSSLPANGQNGNFRRSH